MSQRPDTHGHRPSGLHRHGGVRAVACSVILAALAMGVQAAWSHAGLTGLVSLSAVAPAELPAVADIIPASTQPALVHASPLPAISVIENQVLAHLPVPEAVATAAVDPQPLSYGHRPLRAARTMTMVVTAYCPEKCCCGKHADGITASGMSIYTNGMKLVAADTRVLPMKSIISVPGYDGGRPVPVLDRGGAIKGNRLDLLMPTHAIAKAWGKKTLTVTVYEYAD